MRLPNRPGLHEGCGVSSHATGPMSKHNDGDNSGTTSPLSTTLPPDRELFIPIGPATATRPTGLSPA